MSLLSGIKFVPKTNRQQKDGKSSFSTGNDDHSKSDDVRDTSNHWRSEKRHRKTSKGWGHERDNHRDKKRRSRRDSGENSDDSRAKDRDGGRRKSGSKRMRVRSLSSSSESSVDMEAIAAEERRKERLSGSERRMDDSRHGRNGHRRDCTSSWSADYGNDYGKRDHYAKHSDQVSDWGREHAQPEKAFDPNKFKSLINSLKKTSDDATPKEDQITVQQSPYAEPIAPSEEKNDFLQQYDPAPESGPRPCSAAAGVAGAPNPAKALSEPPVSDSRPQEAPHAPILESSGASNKSVSSTNQSAAALLRERLKRGKLAQPPSSAVPPTIRAASAAESTEAVVGSTETVDYSSNYDMHTDATMQRNLAIMKASSAPDQSRAHQQQQPAIPVPPRKKKKGTAGGGSEAAILDAGKDLDVAALLGKERVGGALLGAADDDIDEVFKQNILRLGERYQGSEMGGAGVYGTGDRAGGDEEGELDMRLFQTKQVSSAQLLEQQAKRALREQQRMKQAVESCHSCPGSRSFASRTTHRIIAQSENVFLLVTVDPLAVAPMHCQIVPKQHVSSMLHCDDETVVEVGRFKSCLRRMFEQEGKGVLFVETAVAFHSRPHACVDAVPLEPGMEAEVQMSFQEVHLRGNPCTRLCFSAWISIYWILDVYHSIFAQLLLLKLCPIVL